jgi:undecaprenyl phosphate-alpha-L-ara4FN deformylase
MADLRIGLRVDVDTLRGTRLGVPALCGLFDALGIRASFFFSVGPDNMGRHLWRLLSPAFLWKMLRSNAPGLYGWSILLRGTFWPGPLIARRLAGQIRQAVAGGHEIGLHAWDHYLWQSRVELWSDDQLSTQLCAGVDELRTVTGQPPTCSAAPAWRCTPMVLRAKEELPFRYNSDCRGHSIFVPAPESGGSELRQPQVPVTLPTFDEMVGRDGMTPSGYYDALLTLMRPSRLNVLTIHAEVEGLSRLDDLGRFITAAGDRGWSFTALGDLLEDVSELPTCRMVRGRIPGRAGWASLQEPCDA